MEDNGCLTMRDTRGNVLFVSNTHGHGRTTLNLSNTGELFIANTAGEKVWVSPFMAVNSSIVSGHEFSLGLVAVSPDGQVLLLLETNGIFLKKLGKTLWKVRIDGPEKIYSGTLTADGNIVFRGESGSEFCEVPIHHGDDTAAEYSSLVLHVHDTGKFTIRECA